MKLTKTYLYNQSFLLSSILFSFDKFKKDVLNEHKDLKFISLNIILLNEEHSLHLIKEFKTNILNKNQSKLNIKINIKSKHNFKI